MNTAYGFTRRGPDKIAEGLATVLLGGEIIEFKPLFLLVHGNLVSRNAANGGEEMLRLRVYEKLQNLVQAGVVNKMGKEYQGVPSGLRSFLDKVAEFYAKPGGENPVGDGRQFPAARAPGLKMRKRLSGDLAE